jgi:hypothetical protein
MIKPDAITDMILKSFPNPRFDPEEKKKLRQANQIWEKVIMIVDRCTHHPFIIHSNGVKECLSKCRKLWVPEDLKRKGLYDNNPNVIWIREE